MSLCVDAEKIKHVNVAFLAGELNLMATGQALEAELRNERCWQPSKTRGWPVALAADVVKPSC